MALSGRTLKLVKVLYWVFLTMIQIYLCYLMFVTNRVLLGILWLIAGFILIFLFYFYYFPWGDPDSRWPPYIRGCPDYLTKISPTACVDYVGLNSPLLRKSDAKLPPPTDPSHIFDSSGDMSQKAARAQQYGLSWEGVL